MTNAELARVKADIGHLISDARALAQEFRHGVADHDVIPMPAATALRLAEVLVQSAEFMQKVADSLPVSAITSEDQAP